MTIGDAVCQTHGAAVFHTGQVFSRQFSVISRRQSAQIGEVRCRVPDALGIPGDWTRTSHGLTIRRRLRLKRRGRSAVTNRNRMGHGRPRTATGRNQWGSRERSAVSQQTPSASTLHPKGVAHHSPGSRPKGAHPGLGWITTSGYKGCAATDNVRSVCKCWT